MPTRSTAGVGSPAHSPALNFYRAPHAFPATCRIVIWSFNFPRFHNQYACRLTAKPSRAFFVDTRSRKKKCYTSSVSSFARDSSSAPQPPLPESQPEKEEVTERKVPDVQTLISRFWKVAAPYWSSDDQLQARWRLATVFLLTLGTTGISVGFNFLGRDFYNSLANKDQEQFTKQLYYYLAAFAGGVPVFVLRDYAKDTLSLRWRSWMTSYYLDRYLKNQTFYKIQSQSIIDNPDQRIVDDLNSFTGTALGFSLTVFNAVVDLVSFSNILYGIYPPLFVILLGYSLGGTAISIFLGRGLVALNFLQEKKEADFRYGLVRVRENAEAIAFYGGELNEKQLLLQRFRSAFENLTKLLISSRNLDFFTGGYKYLIQILPAAVVAPMYFSGKIDFGVISQSTSAFNHILGDFSIIVYQFPAITAFSAIIDRLGEFDDLLRTSDVGSNEPLEEIHREFCSISNPSTSNEHLPLGKHSRLVVIEDLTLLTPNKATLIKNLSLEICEKNHLLVTGPSGSGKTSLLRALAGLWNLGGGTITFYHKSSQHYLPCHSKNVDSPEVTSIDENNDDYKKSRRKNDRGVFFLPQKPYMLLGTLRQQLLYPTWIDDSTPISDCDTPTGSPSYVTPSEAADARSVIPTTDDLIHVMENVRLSYILSRFDLDSTHEWSSVLSIGEQQRLAFARLLLSKPSLVLLDESTSALDEANEAHLYRLIEAAGITYISIGHRRTLYEHHKNVLSILPLDPTKASQNWNFEPINKSLEHNLLNSSKTE